MHAVRIFILGLLFLALPGCSDETTGPGNEPPPCTPLEVDGSYDTLSLDLNSKPEIVIETNHGTMVFELWPDVAPNHCKNFIYLANSCFYSGLTFHRVIPEFVIQGGDPKGDGTGGPGYTITPEFSDEPHVEGTLSMARLPSDENSAGSQFFITLGHAGSLDGKYTVFGHLIEGLDVLHEIAKTPTHNERPIAPVVMTHLYRRDTL